ncbi:MAG: hypothetical protein KDA42_03690 [Planctomycetales bacterium]|nr:hypothetical protein [Planctomycetales bacterium]
MSFCPEIEAAMTDIRASNARRRGLRTERVVATVLAQMAFSGFALAQIDVGSKSVPPLSYYYAKNELYSGEYGDALRGFQDESRGAIKTTQSRWIDSICYYSMIGECYYQIGEYGNALESYTAALRLYASFSDWMIRVQFPRTLAPDLGRASAKIPWGASQRKFRLGRVPDTMSIGQGQIDNENVVRQGGVLQRAILYPINVHEIVRCTALALRRRREIMGPLCIHDPLTKELVTKLSARPGPPNHWSESWIDLQLGLAFASDNQIPRAMQHLQRSIVVAGEFDHPLTCVALLELGRLSMEAGDLPAAAKLFAEASYSAVYFEDPGVLEEALMLGGRVHLIANQRGLFPPLADGPRFARSKKLRHLQIRLSAMLAQTLLESGKTNESIAALSEARSLIGRRDLANGTLGAELNYLAALAAYQRRQPQAAEEPLRALLEFQRERSLWLYQINLAGQLYRGGTVSSRVAVDVFAELLHDPTAADWSTRPRESLSKLLVPHGPIFDLWFEASLDRKEPENAIHIADLARRHRFLTTLPLGGRLLALRWVLEAPQPWLPQTALLQRQDLLVKFPEYDQLSQAAANARNKIRTLRLTPQDAAAKNELSALYDELAAASRSQEMLLNGIALQRMPADLVFPPASKTKEVQLALPKGAAALVFYQAGTQMYGFLINNEQYAVWKIGSPAILRKGIVKLLRDIGQWEDNREIELEELQSPLWQETAATLVDYLMKDSQVDLGENIDELIVVPDRELWYLPFEILPVGPRDQRRMLVDVARVRYAPLLSLAVPGTRPAGSVRRTAILAGRLSPRDDDQVARLAAEKMVEVLPRAEVLAAPLPTSSNLVRAALDRLIVLDDLHMEPGQPFAWSPLPADRGGPQGELRNWLTLPWGSPEQIVLPGFHTAAENSLKRETPPAAGSDMFLSTCAMMAAGSRTLLISRWRDGGRTSFNLTREFVQELPHSTATNAWRRSVALARESVLDWELEPRVKRFEADQPVTAAHPMFWAGYMLIDTGLAPTEEAP